MLKQTYESVVGTSERLVNLLLVFHDEIHRDHLDALFLERLRSWLRDIPSKPADAVRLVGFRERFNDTPTLDARGANYRNEGGRYSLGDRHWFLWGMFFILSCSLTDQRPGELGFSRKAGIDIPFYRDIGRGAYK